MKEQEEKILKEIIEKLVAEGKLECVVQNGKTHYRMTKLGVENFMKKDASDGRSKKTEA